MSDPLENDLRKMKTRVPVPPDFLARVREQIAREEEPEKIPQPSSWWHGWSDFLFQNTFAVSSLAALLIFGVATVIWWQMDRPQRVSPPLAAGQSLQKVMDQKSEQSSVALTKTDSSIEKMAPNRRMVTVDEVIVTIELAGNEMRDESMGADSTLAEISVPSDGGVKPEVDTVTAAIPVFQSKVSSEETVRIVEQMARKYSSALVEGKLAEKRSDLKPVGDSLKTMIIEIDPAKKEAFLAALSNSLQIAPQNLVGGTVSSTSGGETLQDTNASRKVQIQILITPPNLIGAPPKK
ncbi:MAG: hypothetical protein SGI98_01310 [Verrucomicrobiota bacterium]|nr:hypothetical protein [Verrucomicrobiota bacterium]